MYRHVNNVATLIVYADGFLIGVAYGHTHQSAELTDTEVDVHNEVARLHFLQLFHRERHLACTCSIALEVVFVESVKYLVVGEEAQSQVVVGKTLVQCMVYWGEVELVSHTQRLRIG